MGGIVSALPLIRSIIEVAKDIFFKPPSKPPAFKPPPGEAKAALVEEARKQLGIDCTNRYNFAIAGVSGSGKSTFINVIRNVRKGQRGWAPSGESETTTKITPYDFPDSNVTLWDIPGGDTDERPAPTYFRDHKLYAFDAVLIFFHNRVVTSCTAIVQGCKDFDVPVAFIRNKADADVPGIVAREGCLPAQAVAMLRKQLDEQIATKARDTPAHFAPRFLVSAVNMMLGTEAYDMDRLGAWIVETGRRRA